MKKNILLLATILCVCHVSSAQILGRILDRTVKKLENKVESKVVERVSEEIARQAWKSIEKTLDEMLKEQYQEDSTQGRTTKGYSEYLSELMKPVNLPDEYVFDVIVEAETEDYNGDKKDLTLLFRKDKPTMGFLQKEKDRTTYMVLDLENDIYAMYTLEGDEKKVYALSNVFNNQVAKTMTKDQEERTLKKTGRTKIILGYRTDEWLSDSKSYETRSYVAEDFPISWNKSFGKMFQKMATTNKSNEMPKGLTLESVTKSKEKNKTSSYTTKEVKFESFIINNSDFEKASYGQ